MSFIHHHDADSLDDLLPLAKGKSETADFDDIKTGKTGETTLDTYAKLDWDEFDVIDPSVRLKGDKLEGSGYFLGVTSGHQAVFNPDSGTCQVFSENGSFNLDSVEMTAGVDKQLQVQIQGFNADFKMVYDIKVEITDIKATLEKLNMVGVSEIDFVPGKEVADSKWQKLGDSGPSMVFDDFKFSNIKGSAAATPSAAGSRHFSAGIDHAAHLTGRDMLGHADLGHQVVHLV